ncbi:hypothetical protein Aperf_G00000127899 [Anoplocephala perfoliata]
MGTFSLLSPDEQSVGEQHPMRRRIESETSWMRLCNLFEWVLKELLVLPVQGLNPAAASHVIFHVVQHRSGKLSASTSPEGMSDKSSRVPSHKKSQSVVLSSNNEKTRIAQPNKVVSQLQGGLQKEDDIHNCPVCLAPRSVNVESRYCTSCGRSLSQLPNCADVEIPLIMSTDFCTVCGAKLPVNAVKCLVCESASRSFKKELISESDRMDRRLCSVCGSLNPVGLKNCLTCEADLPQTPATLVNISRLLRSSGKGPQSHGLSATPKCPSVAVPCRICCRENAQGVRFCDWCGIHNPSGKESLNQRVWNDYHCVCPNCCCRIPESSRFCFQCGLELAPIEMKNGLGDRCLRESDMNTYVLEKERCSMISQARKKTVSTQTMGSLHLSSSNSRPPPGYPEFPARLRPPVLTPISPGKGLWRMQIEHLVAHVKAYTRNDLNFQQAIGEPRMGKLLFANIDESQAGEVSISFTFRHHNPSVQVSTRDDESEVFAEVSNDNNLLNSSYCLQPQSNNNNAGVETPLASSTPIALSSRTFPKNTARKIVAFRASSLNSESWEKIRQESRNKLSVMDESLMRELRPNHKADMHIVKRLLFEEGANPLSLDHYGDPLVVRAVRNQQLEVIPTLVKSGADVNASGSRQLYVQLTSTLVFPPGAGSQVDPLKYKSSLCGCFSKGFF